LWWDVRAGCSATPSKGAIASANLFSIVETAKANGVEPHAYLSLLFARLPCAKTVDDFEALLPWRVKQSLGASNSVFAANNG
jgi:hypothetical protein